MNKEENINCPNCGAPNTKNLSNCEYCGTPLQSKSVDSNSVRESDEKVVIVRNNKFLIVLVGITIFILSGLYLKSNYYVGAKEILYSVALFFFSNLSFDLIATNQNLFLLVRDIFAILPNKLIIFLILFFIADIIFFWGSSNTVEAKRQSFGVSILASILVSVFSISIIGLSI